MKIKALKIKIEEISHDDLVNLIAIGITDAGYLGIKYEKKAYNDLPDKDEDDCLEDKCAKVLLSGGTVKITDYDADGVGYGGADVPFKGKDDDSVDYTVNLQNILDGLENAANSDFISSDNGDILEERQYIRAAFNEFALGEDSGGFDSDYAFALWQIILFNEVIYC